MHSLHIINSHIRSTNSNLPIKCMDFRSPLCRLFYSFPSQPSKFIADTIMEQLTVCRYVSFSSLAHSHSITPSLSFSHSCPSRSLSSLVSAIPFLSPLSHILSFLSCHLSSLVYAPPLFPTPFSLASLPRSFSPFLCKELVLSKYIFTTQI